MVRLLFGKKEDENTVWRKPRRGLGGVRMEVAMNAWIVECQLMARICCLKPQLEPG